MYMLAAGRETQCHEQWTST